MASDMDIEEHFQTHSVPPDSVPGPGCLHGPLVVDVAPERVYVWMSAKEEGDAALDVHPGWTRRSAPSVVRQIVERENHANLLTPGWYYPHSRSSAAALDALYHDIVRASVASGGPPFPAGGLPGPLVAITREDIRPALLESEPKRRTRIVAVVELSAGLVLGVVGANLMDVCTSYIPFDGCDTRGYGLPGFVLVMAGICFALIGTGSLFSTLGRDITEFPPDWRPGARGDPAVEAGVERLATLLWAGILMAILVGAEAFPIYNLVVLTSAGSHPTFNLGAFLVDMVFFGIADLLVVFLIVTYGSNN